MNSACHLLASRVLLDIFLRPWRWRRYSPPKRRFKFSGLHGVISRKMILFRTAFSFISINTSFEATVPKHWRLNSLLLPLLMLVLLLLQKQKYTFLASLITSHKCHYRSRIINQPQHVQPKTWSVSLGWIWGGSCLYSYCSYNVLAASRLTRRNHRTPSYQHADRNVSATLSGYRQNAVVNINYWRVSNTNLIQVQVLVCLATGP
jgi:hypothetical protein